MPQKVCQFKTAMVIDDSVVQRHHAVTICESLGLHVIAQANNGQDALDQIAIRAELPQLLIVDLEMPIMDGYQATRAIRLLEQHLNQKPLPIIALTAHALPEHREACFAAGMTGYLSKPLILSALTSMLSAYLPADSMAASH